MSHQKTNPTSAPTAGIILIGNELLSGQTVDLNMNYIAKKLFNHGVDLGETIIIPDVEKEIIRVVRDYSKRFTHVFTTGGIGPTHDDITAQTMSKAFDRKHVRNEQAHQILVEKYGEENLTDSRGRMTMMPEGVNLILNDSTGAPGFQVENVFVMAGVPTIMHAMFENALTMIPKGEKRRKVIVACKVYESHLAPGLHSIQDEYPQIEIGSYPHWIEGKSRGVRVAITGRDLTAFEKTKKRVLELCCSFDEKSHCLEM